MRRLAVIFGLWMLVLAALIAWRGRSDLAPWPGAAGLALVVLVAGGQARRQALRLPRRLRDRPHWAE